MQIDAKRAKTCMQCVRVPTELPFCMPLVGGWVEADVHENLAVWLLQVLKVTPFSGTGEKGLLDRRVCVCVCIAVFGRWEEETT